MGDIEKKKDPRPGRIRRVLRRRGPDGALAPFGVVYMALLGLGVLGALAVYLLLVAFVPGASGTRLDAMKTALLVVAGSGAGAGLYVQYRKQQTDEAKSALDHANSRRDQDKLFTERYTQAAAQLGSDKAAVRLAGVYALARIADDSERDRATCLEVLCAYLRMPYDPDTAEPAERQVRTTAQTAIGKRLHPDHPGFWPGAEVDLSGAHLIDLRFDGIRVSSLIAAGATFSGDAVFIEATFSGDARFGGATFGGLARFGGATFSGFAVFGGATFSQYATFSGATFGGFAGFDGATFSGDAVFSGATFSQYAAFGGATFSRYARFGEATFSGDAGFIEATFRDARFDGATFSGDAVFSGATFSQYAAFGGATFSRYARFDEATLSRARPPVWPDGFAEPAGIKWDPTDPPVAAPAPGPPTDPADPPSAP